ncbi:hypothetical protein KVG88_21245 [Pseudomonas sp. SWRI74]|uniref:Uncharacterized protein n=2 Tax=Pseudomonas TaxID=286 RepID=A0A5E6Y2J1_PSEFL|nr:MULTISPECIES: hypothetical protein [Pseudomonas]MBV4522595.1 hypothetical protein [Pseudomonas azerbaijanoccidentalis]VVN47673.1 hypothetical protein PS655_05998 [Pseudomonas fluorescens]
MKSSVEEIRQIVRRRAQSLGISIDPVPSGGYRIHGRNGYVDFRVIDLADVDVKDLAPKRWD